MLLVHFVISSFYLLLLGCMEYIVPDFATCLFTCTDLYTWQEYNMVRTHFISVCNTYLENTKWRFPKLDRTQWRAPLCFDNCNVLGTLKKHQSQYRQQWRTSLSQLIRFYSEISILFVLAYVIFRTVYFVSGIRGFCV